MKQLLKISFFLFLLQLHTYTTKSLYSGCISASMDETCKNFNKLESRHSDNKTPWTMVVFIEASVDMNVYAMKNIADMMQAYANQNMNILVQWHA